MTVEVWKPVVGYENYYEVSDFGNVRRIGGKVLRACLTIHGYPMVGLSVNGRLRSKTIAPMVMAAFVGPRPIIDERPAVVAHNDGVKSHNTLSNLRYDSDRGNNADKIKHGTLAYGPRNGRTKLSESSVLAIRADNRVHRIIAQEFGICETSVRCVKTGKTWRHLSGESK